LLQNKNDVEHYPVTNSVI